jgi:hypothetical protein
MEAERVVAMTVVMKAPQRRGPAVWRWLGVAFLAGPLLVITAFAIGEGLGGEGGWWGHLIQLAVGVGLLAGGWFAPKVVGPLLVVVAVGFGVLTLVNAGAGVVGMAILILWVPMLLAGSFFTLAGYGGGGRQRATT